MRDAVISYSSPHPEWFIGMMSGTSLDGVDSAAVCFQDGQIKKIVTHYVPYPQQLQNQLHELALTHNIDPVQLGEIDISLGRFYADCAIDLTATTEFQKNLSLKDIIAVGSHGQTIRHHPVSHFPFTWQIGQPHSLCQTLKKPVCFDFRQMDMAVGGQGAPLAPLFHQALVEKQRAMSSQNVNETLVLNLGGIANITLLKHDNGAQAQAKACDTGPANTLMNQWVNRQYQIPFDRDGALGSAGQCHQLLLERMLQHPYISASIPKSTGPEVFNLKWIDEILGALPATISNQDVLTTLYHFTVETIFTHIIQISDISNDKGSNVHRQIITAGGGTRNRFLMNLLDKKLGSLGSFETSHLYNIDPEFVEAAAFAWLAQQRFHGVRLNTAPFTGAKSPVILGSIILP